MSDRERERLVSIISTSVFDVKSGLLMHFLYVWTFTDIIYILHVMVLALFVHVWVKLS